MLLCVTVMMSGCWMAGYTNKGADNVRSASKFMIGDKKYVDGGYGDNLPVKMALFRGVERIVSVNLKAVGTVDKKLLDEVEKRHPNYITVEPKWDLGNFLVFEPDVAARNLRLGYLDGMDAHISKPLVAEKLYAVISNLTAG